jgi:hypothetical protein
LVLNSLIDQIAASQSKREHVLSRVTDNGLKTLSWSVIFSL